MIDVWQMFDRGWVAAGQMQAMSMADAGQAQAETGLPQ
jgi:hypothetical protein